MKNLLKGILLGVLLITAISAVTVYRIRDIQGDKPGNKTLWEELRDRYTKGEADTTFVKVANLVKPITFDTVQVTNKATAPTKTSTTYSNDVATTEFVHSLEKINLLKAFQAQGSSVKALPAGASSLFYGTLAMNESRAFQCTYIIPDTISVTGVGYIMATAQGNFTTDTDFNGFFLCSVSGSNYTVIAQTANNGNIWKVAINTYSTVAFASPVTLPPGVYKLYGVYNYATQTTQPQLTTGQGIGAAYYNQLLTNGHKLEGYITGATIAVPAVPFASSTVTTSSNQPSWVLY